jgi:hypothetical protein
MKAGVENKEVSSPTNFVVILSRNIVDLDFQRISPIPHFLTTKSDSIRKFAVILI